jgi:hypothetical protein
MTYSSTSRNGVSIRLPEERWTHILEEHSEMAGLLSEVLETIEKAERVLRGNAGEVLGIREINPGKFLVVVYREFLSDGFVITAFLTRKTKSLFRRIQLWP